ncbi:MAG: hypothetical protein QXL18_00335 [Candidatus Woesearchaeota archaeon]
MTDKNFRIKSYTLNQILEKKSFYNSRFIEQNDLLIAIDDLIKSFDSKEKYDFNTIKNKIRLYLNEKITKYEHVKNNP